MTPPVSAEMCEVLTGLFGGCSTKLTLRTYDHYIVLPQGVHDESYNVCLLRIAA